MGAFTAAQRRRLEALSTKTEGRAHLASLSVETFGAEPLVRGVFSNGLTVLVLEDHAAPVVAVHSWFKVGSRCEKPGKTGICHLFEHLMFGETKKLRPGAFDRKLEDAGAETNAATWCDWTFYHETVPADRLRLALRLEAERMANLVLREPQVASEKEVVANERRLRVEDDLDGWASERLWELAFTKHAYRIPTIGSMEDILAFTPEDCERFYTTYYAPNACTLVLVGAIDPAKALALVQETHGHLAASQLPAEDLEPEPPQTSPRRLEARKPTSSERVQIAYHGPALGDADHATMSLLIEVLAGGRASRLHQVVVREGELATEIGATCGSFRDPSLIEFSATARPGVTAARIEAAIEEALGRLRDELVGDGELEQAVARMELGVAQSLETANGKAELIGFHETVLADPEAPFRRLRQWQRTSASDLRRVARRYFRPEGKSVVVLLPEGDAA
jgi:zinc protease